MMVSMGWNCLASRLDMEIGAGEQKDRRYE